MVYGELNVQQTSPYYVWCTGRTVKSTASHIWVFQIGQLEHEATSNTFFLSDNKGRPMLQPRQRGASSLRLQDGHVFQQINTVKNSQCKNNAHAEYMLQNPGTPENKPSTFPHFLLQHFHYC